MDCARAGRELSYRIGAVARLCRLDFLLRGRRMTNEQLDAKIVELDAQRPPLFTDEALALRFAQRHALKLRYVATSSRWFIYTGKQWAADETLHAFDMARLVCREASAECNAKKIATTLASAKTVAAIERLAKSDRRMAATMDQFD